MQVTCEIDNPAPTRQQIPGKCGACIHLADNGIVGMFRAHRQPAMMCGTLFDCVGLFPLEGLLSTWARMGALRPWQDTPLWYYQFLLARHTTHLLHARTAGRRNPSLTCEPSTTGGRIRDSKRC